MNVSFYIIEIKYMDWFLNWKYSFNCWLYAVLPLYVIFAHLVGNELFFNHLYFHILDTSYLLSITLLGTKWSVF
jgi:hypothetical protein